MRTRAITFVQAQIAQAQDALDTDAIPWIGLIQALLVAVLVFEVAISLRQLRVYGRPAPPPSLKAHVEQETYEKSRSYSRDKLRFSIISLVCDWALSASLIQVGAFARIWAASEAAIAMTGMKARGEVIHSLAFLLLSHFVTSIPAVPMSLYRNFVIEERYGFNKMTLKTYIVDSVKELVVGILVMGPLMAGLIKLIRWAGESFVAYVVIFMFAFQIIAMVLYPTLIQPLFNKLTPLPEGVLKDRVVALAKQLNFPLKSIYVIDGSKRSAHSNAYFYGAFPGGSKHIVIYDTLIEKSTPDEIEAVLAHELGHWAHSDPAKLLGLSQVQIAMTMTLFSLFLNNASLFRAFGFQLTGAAALKHKHATFNAVSGSLLSFLGQATGPTYSVRVDYLPIVIGLELFQLVLHPLDSVIKFLINASVRRMEYAADRFAAQQPRAPEIASAKGKTDKVKDGSASRDPAQAKETYDALLSTALIKMHVQNLSAMHHDALYSAYHYSHPTLAERLDALSLLVTKTRSKHK